MSNAERQQLANQATEMAQKLHTFHAWCSKQERQSRASTCDPYASICFVDRIRDALAEWPTFIAKLKYHKSGLAISLDEKYGRVEGLAGSLDLFRGQRKYPRNVRSISKEEDAENRRVFLRAMPELFEGLRHIARLLRNEARQYAAGHRQAGEANGQSATRSGWLTRLGSWLGGLYDRTVRAMTAGGWDHFDKS